MILPEYPYKVITGQVMAAVDQTAIEARGVSGLYLMERAGGAVADGLLETFPAELLQTTTILCGKGNNGGDGFVVARRLLQAGVFARVALLGTVEELKGDAKVACERAIDEGIEVTECLDEDVLAGFCDMIPAPGVWVDALLGTGAKGAPRGLYKVAIEILNTRSAFDWIVAVDIPSGVEADTGKVAGMAVPADMVYTMGLPKVGQVLPPGLSYCKQVEVVDIGFPRDLLLEAESEALLLTDDYIDAWVPRRDANTHKGSEGHVLVIAGSRGMTGAALMCAQSAITMGAGLLTAACPASLLPIYAGGVWEMLTLPVDETLAGGFDESAFDALFENKAKYSAVIIGPGVGQNESTRKLIRRIVKEIELPLLIDGDGLTALTADELNQRPFPWVATPHPGEMARFFDVSPAEVQADRFGYVKRLAQSSHGAVVLKGACSLIATANSSILVNPTGNPGMATGGMGDVLAGMIGALLGKGLTPLKSAAAGVYLHGRAGDMVIEEQGGEGMRATDVIETIQPALSSVRYKPALSLSSGGFADIE